MKKRLIPIATAVPLMLVACSSPEAEQMEPPATNSSNSSSASSSTSSTRQTDNTSITSASSSSSSTGRGAVEPVPTIEQTTATEDYYPGDPRLIPVNMVSDTLGSFLAEDATSPTGQYYVFCNGGSFTKVEGAPSSREPVPTSPLLTK